MRWFLLPGQQSCIPAKGSLGCFSVHTTAWAGSFCTLGMPRTQPTLSCWGGKGHWCPPRATLPWGSKLWSWLRLGSAGRLQLNWAKRQLVWAIASLCWVLQDHSRFQLFFCMLECVSGPGVESFLPETSGCWLLMFRAAPAHPGEQGAGGSPGVGTLSGVRKSDVAILAWRLPSF